MLILITNSVKSIAVPEDDIKIITSLVKASIGYNESRHDVVKVHNMQFVENIPIKKIVSDTHYSFDLHNPIYYGIFISFIILFIGFYFYKKRNNFNLYNNNPNKILNDSIKNDIKLSQRILNKWINE